MVTKKEFSNILFLSGSISSLFNTLIIKYIVSGSNVDISSSPIISTNFKARNPVSLLSANFNRRQSMTPSIWQLLIVLVIVLVLFGRGKIPQLMGDMAKGIKSFKRGMSEEEKKEDIEKKSDEEK